MVYDRVLPSKYANSVSQDLDRCTWLMGMQGKIVQVGDLRDDHNYPDPISSGVTSIRASVAGEFGGLGYFVEGHTWIESASDAFSAYPLMDSVSQLEVCCPMHSCSTTEISMRELRHTDSVGACMVGSCVLVPCTRRLWCMRNMRSV